MAEKQTFFTNAATPAVLVLATRFAAFGDKVFIDYDNGSIQYNADRKQAFCNVNPVHATHVSVGRPTPLGNEETVGRYHVTCFDDGRWILYIYRCDGQRFVVRGSIAQKYQDLGGTSWKRGCRQRNGLEHEPWHLLVHRV